MIYRKNPTSYAPEDQQDFEAAVIRAIRGLSIDGSQYISHRDICYYNDWHCTPATSRRIGILLKRKLFLIKVNSRNTYKIPEAA